MESLNSISVDYGVIFFYKAVHRIRLDWQTTWGDIRQHPGRSESEDEIPFVMTTASREFDNGNP